MKQQINFKTIALPLIKNNWSVFPLKGKVPITKNGVKDATKDLDQIEAWGKKYPRSNCGIATGTPSGVIVLDIDDGFGKKGSDSMAKLVNKFGKLPETFVVKTGHGYHYYFKAPQFEIRNSASKIGENLDIRGEGGYVVSPRSIHPETKEPYKIIQEYPLSPIPDFLIPLLKEETIQTPINPFHQENFTHKYVQKTLENICSDIANAREGSRNEKLNIGAYSLGRLIPNGYLEESTAVDSLCISAQSCGLKEKEILKTIKSGLEKGKMEPKLLDNSFNKSVFVIRDIKDISKENNVDPQFKQFIQECLTSNEMGDATLLSHLIKNFKLYDHSATTWMTYEKGCWKRDDKNAIIKEAYDALKQVYLNLANELSIKIASESLSDSNYLKNLEKQRSLLMRRSIALGKKGRLENVISLTKSLNAATSEEFDSNPYLLNLLNGTYDFSTDTFKPHQHEDMLTKQSPVNYQHDAECGYWKLFLFKIFNHNHELITYIQKVFGYSLTGLTDLQIFLFCYGSGSNGKSTFFNVMQLLLGELMRKIPIEFLLAKYNNTTDEYQIASLKGARSAVASEMPPGRRLNDPLLKDLTGGDILTARNPYEKPIQFKPTHTLWLFGNHKPDIRGMDEGIWRRVRLIPFTVSIPENETSIPFTT